jgi:hypothetical protein
MIVTKQMDETKAGSTRKLRCPVCKQGRLCDVSRRRQFTMCDVSGMNDEILIKCPICNSNIGITLK